MNISKYFSSDFKRKIMYQKNVFVSKEHVAFLRRHECIFTAKPQVDVHHVQRRSQGHNDYLALPIAHEIHLGEIHQKGDLFVEEKYSIDFKDAIIAKLIERLVTLEKKL